jgi:hypothetical protein
MKSLRTCWLFAGICALLLLPAVAYGLPRGAAMLTNVSIVDIGCVSGPTGNTTQSWDLGPGHTYTITLSNVVDCANGGTDPTLNVRVNSSIPGYEYVDVVATYVSPGVYQFDYFLPSSAWCTLPIFYCTTPGQWLTTGMFVVGTNLDPHGRPYDAHLRASSWSTGCKNPVMILGPECGMIGVEDMDWGSIKAIYR